MGPEIYERGQVVADRYRILRPIGRGGFGGLFLAEQVSMRRPVAFKVLLPRHAGDRVQRSRFEREARSACRLTHPNTVVYHDFGVDEQERPFLVMEYLEGRTLSQLLADSPVLDLARVLHIVAQTCDALHEAHAAGIVHRDLKCSNIMLISRGGDPDFVKVIDFGILKHLEAPPEERLTGSDVLIGTPHYMAPEQLRGERFDGRADQYAVGVILFELLTGHRPFTGSDIAETIDLHLHMEPPSVLAETAGRHIPRLIDAAVRRALAKKPAERFPTMADLRTFLLGAAGIPLTASRPSDKPTEAAEEARLRAEAARATTVFEFRTRESHVATPALDGPEADGLTEADGQTEAEFPAPARPAAGQPRGRLLVLGLSGVAALLAGALLALLVVLGTRPSQPPKLVPDVTLAGVTAPTRSAVPPTTPPPPPSPAAAPGPAARNGGSAVADLWQKLARTAPASPPATAALPAPPATPPTVAEPIAGVRAATSTPPPAPPPATAATAAAAAKTTRASAKGYLSVNVEPFGTVWVDGKSVGGAPIQRLAVNAGRHTVRAVHPVLGERTTHVTVRAGAESRLRITIERPPGLTP